MNKETRNARHNIQPFLDWVTDNKKNLTELTSTGITSNHLALFNHMEEYLDWLDAGVEKVKEQNPTIEYMIIAEPRKKASTKRGLFYIQEHGRTRIYRRELDGNLDGFKLLTYKSKGYAQNVCNDVNSHNNDSFVVEPIKD